MKPVTVFIEDPGDVATFWVLAVDGGAAIPGVIDDGRLEIPVLDFEPVLMTSTFDADEAKQITGWADLVLDGEPLGRINAPVTAKKIAALVIDKAEMSATATKTFVSVNAPVAEMLLARANGTTLTLHDKSRGNNGKGRKS